MNEHSRKERLLGIVERVAIALWSERRTKTQGGVGKLSWNEIGDFYQDGFRDQARVAIQAMAHFKAASITHADWELLAVSELSIYDDTWVNSSMANERGYEVIELLHTMLFGKTTKECGCDV